jgi:hypothetical protein
MLSMRGGKGVSAELGAVTLVTPVLAYRRHARERSIWGKGVTSVTEGGGLLASAIPVRSLLGWAFKSETSKATAAGAGLPLRLEAPFELSKKRCAGPDVLA